MDLDCVFLVVVFAVVWRGMVFLNIPGNSDTYKSTGFRDSIDWFGVFQRLKKMREEGKKREEM